MWIRRGGAEVGCSKLTYFLEPITLSKNREIGAAKGFRSRVLSWDMVSTNALASRIAKSGHPVHWAPPSRDIDRGVGALGEDLNLEPLP